MLIAPCKNSTAPLKAQEPRLVIAQRILSLKREDENDSEFARRIGLTPAAVNNWRQKENGAGLKAILKVLKHVTDADARWLLTGVASGEPSTRELRYDFIERAINGELDDLVQWVATPPAATSEDAGQAGEAVRVTDQAAEPGAGESQESAQPPGERRRRKG